MSQITLVYDCAVGIQNLAVMQAKVAAVNLYGNGELDFLPFTVASDVTAINGTQIRRTIVFDVTPDGEVLYPTDTEKQYATRGLFSQALTLDALVRVTAADPVVTP